MTASSVTVDCMEEERAQAGRYTCTLDVHYRYTRVWSLIGFRLGLCYDTDVSRSNLRIYTTL